MHNSKTVEPLNSGYYDLLCDEFFKTFQNGKNLSTHSIRETAVFYNQSDESVRD